MTKNTIGKEIRRLRELSNLSVNELARRSGVSSAAISRIENECRKNPTVNLLNKLSRSLNVDITYLTSFNNENPKAVSIVELNPIEKKVIAQIKKRKGFFECLSEDPEKQIDKLYRMWKIINE